MNWCNEWRITLSPRKTQVIAFYRKSIKSKDPIYQTILGQKIVGKSNVEFLGVLFDRQMTFRNHHQKIMKELKKRRKMFAAITGTNHSPRASTDISLKIFKSMILPITLISAATVSCLISPRKLQEQDCELRKAARLAIHAPQSTRNDYVLQTANLRSTEKMLQNIGSKYLTNPARSKEVKSLVQNHKRVMNNSVKTPHWIFFCDIDVPVADRMELSKWTDSK